MGRLETLTNEFLAEKVIAVVGVSGRRVTAANVIFRRFKEEGKRVYAVNRNGGSYENERCYPDIASLPETPGAVVIVTRPASTEEIVEDCIRSGVRRVWMHRSVGTSPPAFMQSKENQGSVSERAVRRCRENGIGVIAGACPLQFGGDFGHACMRTVLRFMGAMRV